MIRSETAQVTATDLPEGRLGESVVSRIAARPDTGNDARRGEPLGVADGEVLGGFAWSSQHLDLGGVHGPAREDDDTDGASGDAVAGQAANPVRCRARVLADDRRRVDERA